MSALTPMLLGELVTLQAGVGFPLELQGRTSGAYPLAKVGDISRVGRAGQSTLFAADHYVDEDDLRRLKAKPIPAGSILFAKIGEAIRHNHRVIAGCELLIDNNAMAAIPNDRIDSRFLYHFLHTVDFYALVSATTVPALRKSDLARLHVPVPPLSEQRRIAEVLDSAEILRAKRLAALTGLDTLTKSIFLDLFGDPATNPREWPSVSLGSLLKSVTNGMSRRRSEADPGQSIVLRLRDIREGWIDFSGINRITLTAEEIDRYKVLAGDLLFIRVNGNPDYVGRCALFAEHSEDVYFNDHIMRVRINSKSLNGVFLTFLLNGMHGKREITRHRKTSAGQHTINQDGLSQIRLPLPPIRLQNDFARYVSSVAKLRVAYRASLAELNALFASLQHYAFRGEL